MKLYVKKITSLNPTKYKTLELFLAIKHYESYLGHFNKEWNKRTAPKTFKEWLKTEI